MAETPNATRLVCIIIPLTSPRVVRMPDLIPLERLCTKTYKISGPGEIVSNMDAVRNGKRFSIKGSVI